MTSSSAIKASGMNLRRSGIRAAAGAVVCVVAIIAGGTGIAAAGVNGNGGSTDPGDVVSR